MQLVIDIPDYDYRQIKEYYEKNDIVGATYSYIYHGTPLPKGHGRLIDVDELYSIFKKNCDAYNVDNLSFISDMDMNFDLAPTIIEADKENE